MTLNSRESKALQDIASELRTIRRVLEALNTNLIAAAGHLSTMVAEFTKEVDVDKVLEDAQKLKLLREITEWPVDNIPPFKDHTE